MLQHIGTSNYLCQSLFIYQSHDTGVLLFIKYWTMDFGQWKAAYPEVHWSIRVFFFFGFLKAESLYFQLWNSSLIAVPFSIAPCQSSKHKHHGFKKCLQFREVPPVNPADISAQEPLSGVRLFLFLCLSSRLSPSQGRKNIANCNLLTAWNPPAAMMSILISGIPRQAESVHLF